MRASASNLNQRSAVPPASAVPAVASALEARLAELERRLADETRTRSEAQAVGARRALDNAALVPPPPPHTHTHPPHLLMGSGHAVTDRRATQRGTHRSAQVRADAEREAVIEALTSQLAQSEARVAEQAQTIQALRS